MRQTFTFNPDMDIRQVLPNLSIDLSDVDSTLIIKDTGQIVGDNGIESTDEIFGIARDNFAVIKAQDRIFGNILNRDSNNNNNSQPSTGENS